MSGAESLFLDTNLLVDNFEQADFDLNALLSP